MPKNEFSANVQPSHALFWQNYGGSNGSWGTRTSTTNPVGTFNFPVDTYIPIKLVKQGNNITFYADNSSKGNVGMPFTMSDYTDWTFSFYLWNGGTVYLKNIQIKES